MTLIVPDYYEKFKCIAEKCRHSCCIGWEIDIDPETLEIYKQIKSPFGERLKNCISLDCETPHFSTDNNSRCPFLNKNGLCDIITELGEDALCQICYDHPRFRNFIGDREELGLGICCEAAAELILKNESKVSLITLFMEEENSPLTKKEKEIFAKRNKLFNIFQNRAVPVKTRMKQAAELYNINCFIWDIPTLAKKYRALERLNPKWDDFLNKAEQNALDINHILEQAEQKIPLPAEQLLYYFTYRYFAAEGLKNNTKGAVNFILEATVFCLAICLLNFNKLNLKNFAEVCRLFSLEVEYSEQNISLLLK